jgi:hypothetical protein
MYLSPGTWVRFPRKAKTPIVKGVGEDREVAVPGTPKARAVTLLIKRNSYIAPRQVLCLRGTLKNGFQSLLKFYHNIFLLIN